MRHYGTKAKATLLQCCLIMIYIVRFLARSKSGLGGERKTNLQPLSTFIAKTLHLRMNFNRRFASDAPSNETSEKVVFVRLRGYFINIHNMKSTLPTTKDCEPSIAAFHSFSSSLVRCNKRRKVEAVQAGDKFMSSLSTFLLLPSSHRLRQVLKVGAQCGSHRNGSSSSTLNN